MYNIFKFVAVVVNFSRINAPVQRKRIMCIYNIYTAASATAQQLEEIIRGECAREVKGKSPSS